jgi:hypothetical protein
MYNKTIIEFGFCDMQIIKVSVSVISRAEADNAYLDLDNSAYHKNLIQ